MARSKVVLKLVNDRGRPSVFSERLVRRICDEIVGGKSLRSVCLQEDMPAASTVCLWLADPRHKDFSEQYRAACEARTDSFLEEMLDIADNSTNDWMTINGHRVTNREAIERSKLRVSTRQWQMAKLKPKKYGEKLDIDARVEQVKPILDGIAKKLAAPEAEIITPHLLAEQE